jgi:hypothetical protein
MSFNIRNVCIVLIECIYVFCVILTMRRDCVRKVHELALLMEVQCIFCSVGTEFKILFR